MSILNKHALKEMDRFISAKKRLILTVGLPWMEICSAAVKWREDFSQRPGPDSLTVWAGI